MGDIRNSLDSEDASSRGLLRHATSEREVQQWLSEQLRLRAHGCFHVIREAEAAQRYKPDLIVSSAAAEVQLALEVKFCGTHWSINDFERSLKNQLADTYLRPESRRKGILVVTLHDSRRWKDLQSGKLIQFTQVIERLEHMAKSVKRNAQGDSVELAVLGIDVADSQK